MKPCNGTIFQIQRWSVNDGEGIRSTVFFKGCSLRCQWCANPESWNGRPEVLYFRERCSGCGRCATVCPTGAATLVGGKSELDRTRCTACFQCCEVCPTGARKKMGLTLSVGEVLAVIKRDAIFYRESGGGVTFSGGEPFAQMEFLRQLATACQRLGIDTAVETSGYFDWEQARDIIAGLDAVFVDIKHMDDAVHTARTGVGNQRILANVAAISRLNPNTIVRVPLIEEVNATEKNIRSLAEFLREHTQVAGVELLPYHDFGEGKYNAVGGVGHKFTTPNATKIECLKEILIECGIAIADFK